MKEADKIIKIEEQLEEITQSIEVLNKEIQRLKVFCAYVVEAHEHVPYLRQIWNKKPEELVYPPNTTHYDMDVMKASFMKAYMEIDDRLKIIEKIGLSRQSPG